MLHGFVTRDGRPAVWAEADEVPASFPRRRAMSVVPHPYALPADQLGVPGVVTSADLLLPTAASAPIPAQGPPRRGRPTLQAWRVPAVLADEVPREAGWIAAVADLAEDLVARGRVLPDARCRWRAVLTGADAIRYGDLRRSQPPAVRAAHDLPPEDTQRLLLDHLVDTRVRAVVPALDGPGPVGAWLRGLGTGAATTDSPPADRLADRLAIWQGDVLHPAKVRLCLRLERDGDDWWVGFHLQPLDDPSVLVPAQNVWSDTEAPLRHWTHHPQEDLLTALGRAARLWPDLTGALAGQRPLGVTLDTDGAYRFLNAAPLIEQAGHGVLLPAGWREPPDLGLTLDTGIQPGVSAVLRDEAVNLRAIVDYRWGLALGGEPLTEDELVELARARTPLVRFRGRWVVLDAAKLAAGLRFLAAGGRDSMTAAEALRLVRLGADTPLPVVAATGTGWVADLLNGRSADALELVDAPPGLAGQLRPYQVRGLSWLAFLDRLGLGALLADDMGLGKTVQVLALEARCRAESSRPPTLVVCPLSVLGNWQREAATFVPGLRVHVHHGSDRSAALPPADLVVTTYATATRDIDALAMLPWDRVVLDEAQHVKNSAGGAARALRRLPVRHRIALTGTPVENRLADLWSILDFVNPGLLGPAATFHSRYAVAIERYADEGAANRLRAATRPFLLRRTKADPGIASSLPAKRDLAHFCTLTVEQSTLYRAVLDDLLQRLEDVNEITRKGLILAAMTRLKQVCNHPALFLGDGSPLAARSGKLDRALDILDAVVAAGERALCFTQYARFGTMLQPYLAARFGVPVRYLHGGTPRGARDAMVHDFQADPRPGIFLLSLKAGGTGLNLTAARHVVHLDRWWNPATEAQAADRAYRIGQTADVEVHTLTCLGTLEERIDRVVRGKTDLAARVVGTGEGWLTSLSTADLRELLRLDPEAIGD